MGRPIKKNFKNKKKLAATVLDHVDPPSIGLTHGPFNLQALHSLVFSMLGLSKLNQ